MNKTIREIREGFFYHGLGKYPVEYQESRSRSSMAALTGLYSFLATLLLFDCVLLFDREFKLTRYGAVSLLSLVYILLYFFVVSPNMKDEIDLELSSEVKQRKIIRSYAVLLIGMILLCLSVYITYLLYKSK